MKIENKPKQQQTKTKKPPPNRPPPKKTQTKLNKTPKNKYFHWVLCLDLTDEFQQRHINCEWINKQING